MEKKRGVFLPLAAWLLDVAAVLFLANILALLVGGAFSITIGALEIRSAGLARPFVALVAILIARCAIAVGLQPPLSSRLRLGLTWGAPVILVAAAVAVATWRHSGLQTTNVRFFAALMASAALCGFLACAAYADATRPRRSLTLACVVAIMAVLFTLSPRNLDLWQPHVRFAFQKPSPLESEVPDFPGVLDVENLPRVRVTLASVTRPSVLLSDGDYFRVPSTGPGTHTCAFGLGLADALFTEGAFSAKVTAYLSSASSERRVIFEKEFGSPRLSHWNDIRLPFEGSSATCAIEVVASTQGHGRLAVSTPRVIRNDEKRPNIFLIVVDCLRSDHMSLYGYAKPTSAPIDTIARSAAVYDNVRAVSPWTLPSMSSMFTGLYPSVHGVTATHRRLPEGALTLAQYLWKAGYTNAAFQTNALLAAGRGFTRGFAEYQDLPMRQATGFDRGIYARAAAVNRYALDWLAANGDRPVFVYMHYMDTHAPYEPPMDCQSFGQAEVDKYDAAVLYVSRQVSDFINSLKAIGLLDNSFVILTADHGEQFGEHGRYGHGQSLHPEETRIPLVVWGPGIMPARVDSLIENRDILAMVLAMAGVSAPEELGLVGGAPGRDIVYGELRVRKPSPASYWCAEAKDARLILNSTTGEASLFNPADDPSDARPLPAASPRADVLKAALEKYMSATAAQRDAMRYGDQNMKLTDEEVRRFRDIGYMN